MLDSKETSVPTDDRKISFLISNNLPAIAMKTRYINLTYSITLTQSQIFKTCGIKIHVQYEQAGNVVVVQYSPSLFYLTAGLFLARALWLRLFTLGWFIWLWIQRLASNPWPKGLWGVVGQDFFKWLSPCLCVLKYCLHDSYFGMKGEIEKA